jgi:hypothetical protein
MDGTTIELLESTANMMRGMCMDPRIPQDTKEAMRSRVRKLDAATEAALDDEAGDSDLHDMVRWAYSKLHHASYSKQEDALMLDRMKLLLEHGA